VEIRRLQSIVSSVIGVSVGFGLGLLLIKERPAVLAGFAALGLLFGMVLGLSATPIIGATVTAGLALAGTALQAYLSMKTPEAGHAAIPRPDGRWLLPFASFCVAGIILGIAMRANDVLSFSSAVPNLKEHYLAQGFTEPQVTAIMAAMAKNLQSEKPPALALADTKLALADTKPRTTLQSAEAKADARLYLPVVEGLGIKDPKARLEALKVRVKLETRDEIAGWEESGFDAESIFKALHSR
jgi:hypothetical protein